MGTVSLPVVLVVPTRQVVGEDPRPHDLPEPQLRRWEGLRRSEDRSDFLAARVLAARAVRSLLGVADEVTFAQHCTTCGGQDHGPPEVTSHVATVSWSHAHGVVAATAARAGRLGVDVERLGPDDVVDEHLGVTARAFVRGEAMVKAGLFDLDAALSAPLGWPWGHRREVDGCTVQDLDVGLSGFCGAVAWRPSGEGTKGTAAPVVT